MDVNIGKVAGKLSKPGALFEGFVWRQIKDNIHHILLWYRLKFELLTGQRNVKGFIDFQPMRNTDKNCWPCSHDYH